MKVSRRTDSSRLDKFPRTGAGAVRVPASISRTGVQAYPEKGLREYRPPEEVFAADSLASFASLPVTLGHPDSGVSPQNMRNVTIGHSVDSPPEGNVKIDGSKYAWTKSVLVIGDGDALDAIESASRTPEISAGYECELDMTPGVSPEGEPYDAIQRKIRGNHIAVLLDDSNARAGADARLRLDSRKNMKVIVIDGTEYEVGSEKHIAKLQADAAAAVEVQRKRADKAEGELAVAKSELTKAQAQTSDAALDARVLARFNLIKSAAVFLPGTYETSGKSDHQIRVDALNAAKIDTANQSEDFVSGAFTFLVKKADGNVPAKYGPADGTTTVTAGKNDSNDDDFRAALAKKGESK